MSDALLGYMRFAVEEAERTGMWVILYDEGMYPSGSSSGQVVEGHPELRLRALFAEDPGAEGFSGEGVTVAVVSRKSDGR